MNKPTVTVAVPSYNSAKNVTELVKSLLKMETVFVKKYSILVHVDLGTDNTFEELKKVKSRHLKVINAKKRLGFAGSVQKIFNENKSDILIILNDDIVIKDKKFIAKLIQPLKNDKHINLASGNPIPIEPDSLIERGVVRSFYAYYNFRHSQNIHNGFSFDGKAMVFTKKFIKEFTFPRSLSKMGNVDGYMYLWCKKNNCKYVHVSNARVYFRSPQTIKDYISWQERSILSLKVWKKTFGDLVKTEYQLPRMSINHKVHELVNDPVPVIIIAILNLLILFKVNNQRQNFISRWSAVKSTKKLKLQSILKLVIS